MKYRVVISDEALSGVRDFVEHIAIRQQQPLTASRWLEKALARVATLERMPRRFVRAPECVAGGPERRVLVVDRCLFLFSVNDEDHVVNVVGFRPGSREVQ